MMVLLDTDVPVHYGFLYLLGADAENQADLEDTRAGQVNGLVGAAAPGQLSLITGLHTGRVPLVIRWHDTEPAIGDDWEEVVEVSFQPRGGAGDAARAVGRHPGRGLSRPQPRGVRGVDAPPASRRLAGSRTTPEAG